MRENAIIVNHDLFAIESRVSIVREDGYQEQVSVCSEIDKLAEELVSLAHKYDIYSIKVNAPFAVASEIRRAVKEDEKNMYSCNKITVDGI